MFFVGLIKMNLCPDKAGPFKAFFFKDVVKAKRFDPVVCQ